MFKALGENVLFVQFVVLLGLAVLDVVLGVALGIKTGTFAWGEVARFLKTNVAPYILVWGVLAAAGWAANRNLVARLEIWSL